MHGSWRSRRKLRHEMNQSVMLGWRAFWLILRAVSLSGILLTAILSCSLHWKNRRLSSFQCGFLFHLWKSTQINENWKRRRRRWQFPFAKLRLDFNAIFQFQRTPAKRLRSLLQLTERAPIYPTERASFGVIHSFVYRPQKHPVFILSFIRWSRNNLQP